METRGYTKLDRASILETLESRLSESQSSQHGPQVQLFRVDPPPKSAASTFVMPRWRSSEGLHREELAEDTPLVTPTEDLIQLYNMRIQIMQRIIDQLRVAGKECERWEDDARRAREELGKAKQKISTLEDDLEQTQERLRSIVEERDTPTAITSGERQRKTIEAAGVGFAKCLADLEAQGHAGNDIIRLHHIAWGTESINDALLERRLVDCAAQSSSILATRDFVGRSTGPGQRKTLIIAYSVPPTSPMRWLIIDEGHEGRFDV